MSCSDPERAKIAARERKRQWRAKNRPTDWVDGRGKHRNHIKGSKHHRWNASRMLSEHGYVKVRVGQAHPVADPNGYAYEHLIVWLSAGRSAPAPGEVIHHKDEDKTNNQLDNLELVTRGEHNKIHNHRRGDRSGPQPGGARLLDDRTWDQFPEVAA